MNFYFRYLKKVIIWLKEHHLYPLAVMVGELLSEPLQVFHTTYLYFYGMVDHFHYHGMNPNTLSSIQLRHRPVLLVHGHWHNHSAWFPLARELEKHYPGPVFSLNIVYGSKYKGSKKELTKKIDEIKELYRKGGVEDVQIDFVGHSRGCNAVMALAMDSPLVDRQKGGRVQESPNPTWRYDFGKLIRIGNPLSEQEKGWLPREILEHIYEIVGHRDVISHDYFETLGPRQYAIDRGHLGVLYSHAVNALITEILTESSSVSSPVSLRALEGYNFQA